MNPLQWMDVVKTKDPLVSKWWNAKFLQIVSGEETYSSKS